MKIASFIPLNDLLKEQLARIADGRITDTVELTKKWRQIVGESLSGNAEILYLKAGILHVSVNNSAWMFEMGFMRTQILDAIRKAMPGMKVEDIRLKLRRD